MSEQVSIGNVSILSVQDTPLSGSRPFMFPDVQEEQWAGWEHYFNPRGNLRMNVGSYIVRSEGKTVIVDTGLGDKPREGYPTGGLLGNLAAAGLKPEEIDIVLITHLHIDHVGWNTVRKGDALIPTFSRARYLIARTEWDYFTAPEQAEKLEYIQDSVLPLKDTGQLDLVEQTHAVTGELTLVPSPGHTPGHVCLAIVSGAERGMIIGDMAHHPVQMTETEWSVAFDLNPRQAAETRARIVEQLERDGSTVIGGHFPSPGIGRLVRMDGRRLWVAAGESS
jgi:glyoxylase-like metal-dependent hydrolase (beta-lactamase superfamily II)